MMALRDSRGQVSLEFIILVGAILVMVVAAFPYIARANELNKALAAARDGATFAAGMRGLGYRGENVAEIPPGVVKIKKIEMVNQGNYSNLQWYRFEIHISAPSYITSNSTYRQSLCGTVTNQAMRYVYYAFNGEWKDYSRVNTTYYSFTAGCEFE